MVKMYARIKLLIRLIAIIVFIINCLSPIILFAYSTPAIEVLDDIIDLKIPRHLFLSYEQHPIVLYSTKANHLTAYDWRTGKKIVINNEAKGHSSGFVGSIVGKTLHLVWREKTDVKKLFYRSLNLTQWKLSPPILIDQSSAPLTRIKVGATDDGKVEILWYGEKAESKTRRQYAIYSSSSYDNGQTFTKAVKLTPEYRWAIYPTLLVDNQETYMFTEGVTRKGKHDLVCRRKVGKSSWMDKTLIPEIGKVSLFIRAVKVSNRVVVAWFNTYDGVPVTEIAYSDDNGKTWKRHTFEETRNLDLTSLQLVTNDKNKVYIALSGVKLKEDEDLDPRRMKDYVYIIYSHDKGNTWSKLIPLRHYPFKNTRAHLPKIVAHDDTVVVVWNDYRNIRGNIYMNYSLDGGKTWQLQDIPLEEPGKFNSRLHWNVNNLVFDGKGNYYVLAHRFKSDALEEAYPILIRFSIDK